MSDQFVEQGDAATMDPSHFGRWLNSRVISHMLRPGHREKAEARAEKRRQRAGLPHRLEYFHQIDDAYSHLAAQTLAPLVEKYGVELVPHLVHGPSGANLPEPDLLPNLARHDAALVARAGVQDVIISNRLVSMIMAQISESRDIEKVYDDIFEEDGSEIYLKPASLYFTELPIEVSFADMMRIAQKRSEVCMGVKIKALENNREDNNGITLIPEKNTRFTLNADDSLVVVAEDEL